MGDVLGHTGDGDWVRDVHLDCLGRAKDSHESQKASCRRHYTVIQAQPLVQRLNRIREAKDRKPATKRCPAEEKERKSTVDLKSKRNEKGNKEELVTGQRRNVRTETRGSAVAREGRERGR